MDVRPSRRQVLVAGAAATTAALTTGAAPHALLGRAAGARRGATLRDIEHVIILIQENRSFDHYFGTYRGVRGFGDPGASRILAQPDPANTDPSNPPVGRLLPFHLDISKGAECTHDINHSWGPQHASWHAGAMDGFVTAHRKADGHDIGPLTMGYYERADLPFHHALANAFTICDGYHSAVLGATDPNRLYTISATLDPDGRGGGPLIDTLPSPTPKAYIGRFTWTTMPERLAAAGVSWKVYQSPAGNGSASAAQGNTANNVLAYFKRFVDDTRSPLYRNAFLPTYPADFRNDVAADALPDVSWVLFEQLLESDEHPPSPPAFGAQAMRRLLSILTEHPKVWAKTALFITYDENGGFFDHVRPPTAPAGTPGEYVSGPLPQGVTDAGPIGLGFRVPMLVVSPFSRGGLVCSDTFDHTSVLRFIETRFGVEVPNLSAWRRSVTGDLTSAFDFAAASDASAPSLPAVAPEYLAVAEACSPADFGLQVGSPPKPPPPPRNSMPVQEPGQRRRPSGPVA